jgi:hypothetical protein
MPAPTRLLSDELLRLAAFHWGPAPEVAREKLDLLQRIRWRQLDGTVMALTEKRVQQSFNEQIFGEVFDYRTLYRHGRETYHLRPETYAPGPGQSRNYDDFSLGFFGVDDEQTLVSAELKGHGVDLDRPQSRTYEGKTPVEQAHETASRILGVEWVIVCNFDELRLYRVGRQDAYQVVRLSDVLDLNDLARAYAIFSRATLMGEQGQASPLFRLLKGDGPMLLPECPDKVRLVHLAKLIPDAEAPTFTDERLLTTMDQALFEARTIEPSMSPFGHLPPPVPRGDRVVVDGVDGLLIEASRSDILHACYYLDLDKRRGLHVEDLAQQIAAFVRLAQFYMSRLGAHGRPGIEFSWELLDIDGAICHPTRSWRPQGLELGDNLLTIEGVTRSRMPAWHCLVVPRITDAIIQDCASTIRELLYPFRRSQSTNQWVGYRGAEDGLYDQLKRLFG